MTKSSISIHIRDSRDSVALKLEEQDRISNLEKVELAFAQEESLKFIKSYAFNTIIRRILHDFDPTHKHTDWNKKDTTPLGGHVIHGHSPAFTIKPNYPNFKRTRVPGYSYEVKFGPAKPSFEISATICKENSEIYLAVSFVVVNGLTHVSSKPMVFDSREKLDLEIWLYSLCELNSQSHTINIAPDSHFNSKHTLP